MTARKVSLERWESGTARWVTFCTWAILVVLAGVYRDAVAKGTVMSTAWFERGGRDVLSDRKFVNT